MRLAKWALTAAVLASTTSFTSAAEPDERFIAGYAAAVLEREFSLRAEGLEIVGGEIRYPARGFGTLEKQQLIKSLGSIPGVSSVVLIDDRQITQGSATQPVTASPRTGGPAAKVRDAIEEPLTFYLSVGRLFEPLVADPRWPHFFASYNYYRDSGDEELRHAGSVGFGETISLVRKSYANNLRVEGGIQAGVFAIFDLEAESLDLVNADYFVGPYAAFRYGDFSLLGRVFHQSSHLGDEYLLRDPGIDRVNVSYEAVDLIASLELPAGFRIYGGAGYLFHKEPEELKPWTTQYGLEFRSPYTVLGNAFRPIMAADFQHREESDWELDLSLRVGVQVEDPGRFSQRMLLMLEYYDGRSPNGQFYDDRIQYFGAGLHFYF
ncbi:MAG TPA: DUF1207 domain-containing protein [Tepidisphaeraceae bacterium]|jgi:hypothetical protein